MHENTLFIVNVINKFPNNYVFTYNDFNTEVNSEQAIQRRAGIILKIHPIPNYICINLV